MKSTNQKFFTSIIFFLFLVYNNSANAQFWTEDFVPVNTVPAAEANGYMGVNPGAWSVTNLAGNFGTDPNVWYISCQEASVSPNNCGATCGAGPFPPPTPVIGQSLHIGSNGSFFGDNGALYIEGGGIIPNTFDTELRAESPTINCSGQSNIVLSFNYIEFGESSNDNAQVWYFDGVTWSLLADMPKTSCGDAVGPCNVAPCTGSEQGYWTAFSIALPASANNNASVKIGFYWQNIDDGIATDPSVAIGRIQLSTAAANTITAGNLVGPFCAGATASLPFLSTGLFAAGNIYTAQLSDAAGSFASQVSLGSFTSTANVGNIGLTIPTNTPSGAGYMIQIVSSAPNATSTAIGPFTITALAPLSVTVTADPGTAICPGECITFNTAVTNGGLAPTYQWQINGINAPAPSTLDSLNVCTLLAGDIVSVIVTSNLTCVSNSPADTSAPAITNVISQPFSVTLQTTPNPLVICAGQPIALTANTVNGGLTPTYAWTINNTLLPGISTQTLNYTGIPIPVADGSIVCVIAASSIVGCVTNSPDTVCTTVSVTPSVTPTAIIVADTTTICVGGTINFTSFITNGGLNPTYQWYVGANAVPAPAGTSSSFTSSSLVPGDNVSLVMTSNAICLASPTAISDTIAINVLPFESPTINIAPNSGVCPGQGVTFNSSQTGGGTNPQYFWYLNDTVLLGTDANLTVNSSIFANGDTLTCTMVSNYPCLSNDTAISNIYTIQLLAPATLDLGPDVSIYYGETYKTDPAINGLVSAGFYLWTPDSTLSCNTCFSPIAVPTVTTEYVLVYKNPSGCVAKDTIKIDVLPNYEVFIPSAFSPNGDNINDVFYVRGPFIRSCNMKIWDRLGGLIFESPYLVYGWDGTKNFNDVNTGVFIYYITVEFLDGVQKEFKGNINLSR